MHVSTRLASLVFFAVACLSGTEAGASEFKAVVEPLAGENLNEPCSFDLTILNSASRVRAVWITYDRGFDISKFYSDLGVHAFAQKQSIALMLAHQCAAKAPPTGEKGEMDMDISHGVARSLFAALKDFARQTDHAEISDAKLILMGFSGISAMFGHFVQYAPDRVVAAVLANPGQTEPYGMKDMNLSPAALAVPQFIITGGIDDRGGTQRPWDYFSRHRSRGAPWVFLVQNGLPHCCVINVKALILEWLGQMMKLREPASNTPLRAINVTSGWNGFILPCANGKRDTWGIPDWNVCDASVRRTGKLSMPTGQVAGGWFPNHRLASDWLVFIRERQHPATSFPDGKDALHSSFATPMK
jgi:hypothetical protein